MNDFDYENVNIFKKKGKREIKDPIKSFKDIMSAVSIDLGLSQDDISNMKNSLSKVNKIQYKNTRILGC